MKKYITIFSLLTCFLGTREVIGYHYGEIIKKTTEMKRFLFIVLFISTCITTNAQFNIETPKTLPEDFQEEIATDMYIMQEDFCFDKNINILISHNGKYYLYDKNLSFVRSIVLPANSPIKKFKFYDCEKSSSASAFLSQTLFNDDEKFEYISGGWVNEEWGTWVYNEDGEAIVKLDLEGEFQGVWKIGNCYYLVTGSTPYRFYKINKPSDNNAAYSRGDVNEDGVVNVADHVKLSEIIMDQNK